VLGLFQPSGLVPVGDTITYWVSRLAAWVVLPNWAAAASAAAASWWPVAPAAVALVAAVVSSYQTPARTGAEG
jgi:hypothetical protein